ncbi:hypothetical protein BGZ49_005243 [Haplosporangium sp. Z 27]|nr:hypothetical protein BGZ49_005243 [Haplosporangium sp. Z 27]
MIGSPFTLNIRNLLWHGFIIPGDDIPLDAYGAMLIAATMSIAHSAKKTLDSPLIIRHLNPKSFYEEQPKQDQTATSLSEFDRIFNATAYGPMPPPVDCSHLSEVLYSLVQKSLFVTPGTLDQWIVACRHLNPESSSSFVFTMSTLPLIEHALRLVYVATNQCKQDRTSALIAGEYYLTLDVILDKAVPVEYFESDSGVLLENADHENIQNKLFLELETSTMNLMYDLFILGLGPRLRDRTSHGELNSYLTLDVTKEAWFGYYIGLVVYLLYKYLPGNSEEIPEGVKQYILWKDQYSEYRFDERSIVKRETSRCQTLLAKYVQFLASSTVGSEEAAEKSDSVSGIEIVLSFDSNAIFTKLESFSGKVPLESLLSESISAWSSSSTMLHKGPTASRFSSNLPAWILIVQGVQNAIEKVTTKIRTFSEQLALRQLSSRSRKQFENMKPLIPRLLGMLIGCLAIVERVVLIQDENLKVNFSGSTEGIEARLEEKGSFRDGRINGDNASVVDKSSKEEIMLRLKITTFVDKFISNFDSVKLNLIEPAWKELENSVELLLEGKASSR